MSRYKKRTIYQILVESGIVSSKKQAFGLVRNEKVIVDGLPITSLHYKINPRKSKIVVDQKEIKLEDKRRYFILNKPEGLVTTKQNILKFLKGIVKDEELFSYYPVGRLDKNTSGLLIITNDGRLGNKILNPKKNISKTYKATVSGRLNDKAIEQLKNGVEISLEENGIIKKYKTLPARIRIINFKENKTFVEIIITEGKKRQIIRMFKAVNYRVIDLKRTNVGKIELGNLKISQVKEVQRQELYKRLFE